MRISFPRRYQIMLRPSEFWHGLRLQEGGLSRGPPKTRRFKIRRLVRVQVVTVEEYILRFPNKVAVAPYTDATKDCWIGLIMSLSVHFAVAVEFIFVSSDRLST